MGIFLLPSSSSCRLFHDAPSAGSLTSTIEAGAGQAMIDIASDFHSDCYFSLVSPARPVKAVESQIEGLALLDADSEPHDADVATPEVGSVTQLRNAVDDRTPELLHADFTGER